MTSYLGVIYHVALIRRRFLIALLAFLFFPSLPVSAKQCDDLQVLRSNLSTLGVNMTITEVVGLREIAEFGEESICVFILQYKEESIKCLDSLIARVSNYYEFEHTEKVLNYLEGLKKLSDASLQLNQMNQSAVLWTSLADVDNIFADPREGSSGFIPQNFKIKMKNANVDKLLRYSEEKGWIDTMNDTSFLSLNFYSEDIDLLCTLNRQSDEGLAAIIRKQN